MPRSVIDLAAALARSGHQVRLVSGGGDLMPQEWGMPAPGRPTVVPLRAWSGTRRMHGLGSATDRAALLDAVQWCDVAHLHAVWDPLAVDLGRSLRRHGRPYLVTAHGMLDDWTMAHRGWKKRLFLALGGRAHLERAAALVTNSEDEAKQSARWCPNAPSRSIPLLVDLQEYDALPPKPHRAGGPFRLLFLGRLDPIKRVDALIRAATTLAAHGVDCTLDIAGDGELRGELERLVASTPGGARVRFHGAVAGVAKRSLLRDSDLLVLPSRHENWGIVLVEAMAAGTPVVTTSAVNIARELESEAGAIVVPPDDEAALRTSLASLIDEAAISPDALLARGERGRAWVRRELAPERVIAAHVAAYQEAIDRRLGVGSG